MGKYFGTDGIRGRVGQAPMTVDFAVRLAGAAGRVLTPGGGSVVVGKDPRLSGYMFESALEAGFVAAGVDVKLLQVMPTPGIAFLTKALGADFGVVISASHNAYIDNGIKFFDHRGSKLSDHTEAAIERALEEPVTTNDPTSLGRAERRYDAVDRYHAFCRQSVGEADFSGLNLVVDCANGATYKVAPRVFSDLGADVMTIGCSPNGRNINEGCGSTAPDRLRTTVTAVGADLGVAFDGDGDRVLLVGPDGSLIDGDDMVYLLALDRQRRGELNGPVVGTLMSNLGLELALREHGIAFERTKVGDRHVLTRLHEVRGTIGGEGSGHVLCLDRTTTGDGIITALQVVAALRNSGGDLKAQLSGFYKFPQHLVNVRVEQPFDFAANSTVSAGVAQAEQRLGSRGRVLLRASGTEPLIRVMVEGEDEGLVSALAAELARAVQSAASAS
ncbi:MAG: phosphoglucosamine mutase [Pseudomonadota bacterium]